MPIVQIEMFEGRTLEQKRNLVEKVTEAIVESLSITPERVSIIIREMSKESFSKGGLLEIDKEIKKT
ncbi:MAG: 2-hydroxymuconate tautomerase [Desulfitobacteriaceae bacterium]